MAKVFLTVLSLALSFPAAFAVGAIARNPGNNDSVVVVNKSSRDAAIHDAILSCGSDCVIVTTFQNSCAAYAADHRQNSTKYGYGLGSTEDQAGEIALDHCQDGGGSCTVMSSGCDGH